MPQFRCTDSMCGFFGWRFKTPSAIKKHAAQYYQERNQAIVPTSLAKRPRQPGESRPLFGLREPSSVVIGSQAGDIEALPSAATEPALAGGYASTVIQHKQFIDQKTRSSSKNNCSSDTIKRLLSSSKLRNSTAHPLRRWKVP